ncbi:hypothetical protein L6164_019954 [Bauhinia variegata]|uniref:Uncharacterized protein n=1 Tax=Bauhinia variegata TaxID=167791 RepID=A0ACB9MVK8_BAUVA|nr:hypothetical protein L6164_019954 [Bauhinia variegata]
MSSAKQLSWLCRLINESLRPYTEPEVVVLICKEKEKEILVALSQVLREIQLRIRGFDSNAQDAVVKPARKEECLCGSNLHSDSGLHRCLPTILANFMIFLAVKSEFIRHLAVNALVSTSKFLLTTGNNWSEFIHLLCHFLEMAIGRACNCSSKTSSGAENSDIDFPLQYGLKHCDWSTVACINLVLRVIFKYLKEDYDDRLVKVYYDSFSSCVLKMPWDLLDEDCVFEIGGANKSSYMNLLHPNSCGAMEPATKFLGTFLQLLCSLVDQNDFAEHQGGSTQKHPLIVKVIDLVPRLVKWCLDMKGDIANMCIIQYFKHKLLVLMIRLSSETRLDCSILLSWLKLLHRYFQELLWQDLRKFQFDQDDCLEGSPFILSISDGEVRSMHSSHLQRQAVYLFLNCSFRLICRSGDTADCCVCSTSYSCLTYDPDSDLDHCCRKKGLLELYKWLQGNLQIDITFSHENYLEICINFMNTFLQLFLREDDLLFEVLLQLLSFTSCLQQEFDNDEAIFQDVKEDFLFHLSDVFNPVHLFHLFLSEIHYDHQVLLDYLISKDTGISCAKYLLRCLHLVFNSWKSFMEFPLYGEPLNQSSCKKRKVSKDDPEFRTDVIPSPMDNKGTISSLKKKSKQESESGLKHYNRQPVKEAIACLLSLKISVENLHQKNLFPYNPEVLLRRLRRFQELCREEVKFHEWRLSPNNTSVG